ncbi:hypothetical protein PN498_13740 [Oscillatoria sp. CS-180]|uniref:hypothetical protein n=1 Tax=Oscillatoria sp. CS-180 TaxID=3021720 RepID=UPI0023309445|nr:hypothetical protein [Oscillatoria sp. CS-180]MDB9527058.1 hypothetical protein [Oscillatoria sp. CS-180]
MRSRNRVDELLQELSGWEARELRELKAALGGLLEAVERDKRRLSEKGSRGHIEEKYIQRGNKRHGPYLYLRYWQDGKLRSKYLGKKKSE